MTRSASQRYTERHKEKDSPHTGRRARRRRRRRRLVRQKGQRVDDTLRALLRVLCSLHITQVVSSLRASSIPTKSAFVPVVTSPSITSRFFDRRRGGRGSTGSAAGYGIFRDGKDFRGAYFRQDLIDGGIARRARGGEVCGSSPFRHFATCAFVSDT